MIVNLKNQFNHDILHFLYERRKIDLITKCWNWTGSISVHNYGRLQYNKIKYPTHRLAAYLSLGFDLSSPLYVLHKCDNTKCFNPLHLYIGDQFDNMRDCVKRNRNRNRSKTHCQHGHEYNEENTLTVNRKRYCRECQKERKKLCK